MNVKFVRMVEGAAKARGEIAVPREFIVAAIERIEVGEYTVTRYPSGMPSLKDVFDVAIMLHAETQIKH